jgi:hypothetical protein
MAARIFLLSPASCAGERGRQLLAPRAAFELARRVRGEGAPLGDVFAFVSALYFRGKLAYARRFAAPPHGASGVHVITPDRGLALPETIISARDLRAFARVPVDAREPRFATPLRDAALALRAQLCAETEVVLLGSIASAKYVDVLLPVLGRALRFPADFVGRGDMSRGGQLLRAARAGVELTYQVLDGAARRGSRPAKLPPLRATLARGAPRSP